MPRTFRDEQGREWRIKVHVPARNRVHEELGIDLLEVGDGQLVGRLIGNPVDLVGVLWLLCEQQAADRGVTAEDFGAALAGDAIDSAIGCLLEALCDFFPPSRRAVLQAATRKVWQTQQRAEQESLKTLESPRMQQMLDDALAHISNTFTDSAGSSASTPARTK